MKFKKGDVVTVRGWEEMAKEHPVEAFGIRVGKELFSKFMKPLCGKSAIVEEVVEGDQVYRLRPMAVEDLKLDWEWDFTDEVLKEGV